MLDNPENHNAINDAVSKFADELDISGSNGDRDLYRLLKHYLTKKKVRTEINEVLSNNKCY
jgi:hypothetical protein